MPELQLAPARDSSNAAAVVLALAILAAAAAAIFYFNPHRVADFKVTRLDTYAPRTTFTNLEGTTSTNGTHVLDNPSTSTEQNLYVIASVRLTDKLRLPIFLTGGTAHVTLADGTRVDADLLSSSDLKRLGVIFPEIQQRAVSPISDGDSVTPGQTRTGTVVLPFPGQDADSWHNKKSATLTLTLRNQDPITAELP